MASDQLVEDSALSASFLKHEIHSESTFPLLSYFLRSRSCKNSKDATKCFHEVIAGIGKDRRVIPDESVQLEKVLLELIAKGPGNGKKIPGNPKVKSNIRARYRLC